MNKQEWKELYEILDQQYSRFLNAYASYRNGKNKKIRDAAEREVNNAINTSVINIKNKWEAYLLATDENGDDYHRSIIFNEFQHPRYFEAEMYDLLKKIETKIKSFE